MPAILATFNVKDLFEATDSASRAHLDAKLAWLAKRVHAIDADLLALQEVGEPSVLRELCAGLPNGGGYGEPLVGVPDSRGIRCALLSRYPVLVQQSHTSGALEFPTFYLGDPPPFGGRVPLKRGILHAVLDAGAPGPIHVLVAHLKSNRPVPLRAPSGDPVLPTTAKARSEGDLRSLAWRAAEALFLRGIVEQLFEENSTRSIAVMGDLNDTPESLVVRIVSGDGTTSLAPAADVVPPQERFSHLHRGIRCQIDHVLLSSNLRARVRDAAFLNGDLRDHGGIADGVPTADSDHAAFVVKLA